MGSNKADLILVLGSNLVVNLLLHYPIHQEHGSLM